MSKLIFNPEKDMKELEKYGYSDDIYPYNFYHKNYFVDGVRVFIDIATGQVHEIHIKEQYPRYENLTHVDDLKKANLIIDEEELKCANVK